MTVPLVPQRIAESGPLEDSEAVQVIQKTGLSGALGEGTAGTVLELALTWTGIGSPSAIWPSWRDALNHVPDADLLLIDCYVTDTDEVTVRFYVVADSDAQTVYLSLNAIR